MCISKRPASTFGKKFSPKNGKRAKEASANRRTETTVIFGWRRQMLNRSRYPSRNLVKPLSKPCEIRPKMVFGVAGSCPRCCSSSGGSRYLANVGTTVLDRRYEASMANTTASASGTNRYLAVPARKKIGTKTIQMQRVETKAGTAI